MTPEVHINVNYRQAAKLKQAAKPFGRVVDFVDSNGEWALGLQRSREKRKQTVIVVTEAMTMGSKVLPLVATLLLVAGQIATGGRVLARGGHWPSGSHFVHPHFGHFAHRHFDHRSRSILVAPYAWDWPYTDSSGAAADAGDDGASIPDTPPAFSAQPAAATRGCRWHEETFTVPSAGGGTRPIKITTCQ
jgi:hypothetical protein